VTRRRILFVGEAVTLAHVARPLVLAQSLDPTRYDACFACDPRYNPLLGDLSFEVRPIHSIASEQFLRALATGHRFYERHNLRAYIKEDLTLLHEVKPELVVGDFRLSLMVSARLAGVPYMNITNATWSPYGRQRYPLPEHPLTRFVGVPVARALAVVGRPLTFLYYALPFNAVRSEYGLPSLGYDLRRIYTDADHTLYADIPELVPTFDLPPNHYYLGPILWEPDGKLPPWWDSVPHDRPVIYVTLGTSGQSQVLPVVLEALAGLPVWVIAATADRIHSGSVPSNVFMAGYLPGVQAAARARLMICNGGSGTTYQALAAGIPMVGIASNMDQHLNIQAIQRAGAGRVLRAGQITPTAIEQVVTEMLAQASYSEAAHRLRKSMANYSATRRFQELVAQVLP
jgi:UDP:flavonoid glycosyltransferase YjiC (YdhE family)